MILLHPHKVLIKIIIKKDVEPNDQDQEESNDQEGYEDDGDK
jgi:hypothetical protein